MRHHQILTYAGQQFVETHFTDWGSPDNPNLVFCVHGLTRHCRDFDELALALSDRYRVIAVDVVGRGLSGWLDDAQHYHYGSYIQQLTAVLSHVNARSVRWVGTSMGGLLGMLMAAAPHTPIVQLVLSDVGPVVPKAALEAIADYLGKAPAFGSFAELERYVRQVHSGFGALSDQQWRHLATHGSYEQGGKWHLHYDPAIATNFTAIEGDVDLSPAWQQLRCPVLVLRGAQSSLLTAEAAAAMTSHPRVTLYEFAGVGHAPMMMSADQIHIVKSFLNDE